MMKCQHMLSSGKMRLWKNSRRCWSCTATLAEQLRSHASLKIVVRWSIMVSGEGGVAGADMAMEWL